MQSTTTTEVVSEATTEAINKVLEALEVFNQPNNNIEYLKHEQRYTTKLS